MLCKFEEHISKFFFLEKRVDVPHPHSLCGLSFFLLLSSLIVLSSTSVISNGNGEAMGCSELGDDDLDARILGVSSDLQAHRVS